MYFCFYFQYSGRWVIEVPAVIYIRECFAMFSSRSLIVFCLTFRSLIHFELMCMVLESVLVSFFYTWLTSFPSTLVKEVVFSSLYILASFVEDKMSIGAWIYLWVFHFVPLIYISVFVPVPYCLDDYNFIV